MCKETTSPGSARGTGATRFVLSSFDNICDGRSPHAKGLRPARLAGHDAAPSLALSPKAAVHSAGLPKSVRDTSVIQLCVARLSPVLRFEYPIRLRNK
eukprot:1212545-Prymnesium_polylepis.1